MTTNKRGGAELKPMTKEERAALEIFQNLAHEDRKYDGGYVLDISLGVPAIAEALESTRRAAIAEAMESEPLRFLIEGLEHIHDLCDEEIKARFGHLGMNEEKLTKWRSFSHLSLPRNLAKNALEKFRASLSENQTKGKGDE